MYVKFMGEDVVKLGERGQITIPLRIRKKHRLASKSLLRVYDVDDVIIIKKVDEKPFDLNRALEILRNLHLTEDDFCPEVEKVLTVGEFYELSAGAQIIFT